MREIITEAELLRCPINEEIKVLDLVFALEVLRMDVYSLDKSFLTGFHKEMVNHMLQRGTMATKVLFSPNICAELFTLEQYTDNTRYIINKLVGRRDYEGYRQDFDDLERQTRRKILKLVETKPDNKHFLIFFWDRQPNLIRFYKDRWLFYPESPTYKIMVEFYGRHKLVEPEEWAED